MNIIKAVTYNLRCVWKGEFDEKNSFMNRGGMVYDKIMHELPDVIMFQEVIAEQLEFLKRCLKEYDFYGHFREKDYTGEGLYTAVKRDSVQVVGYDSYWLSPTPYVSGSRFENQSDCPRTCLTLKLRETKTGKTFKCINVHLDHISDEARIEGIKLLLDTAAKDFKLDNMPVILGGDFNALPDSKTIEYCNEYKPIRLFDITGDIKTTFHNFGRASTKIDYLYVSENIKNVVKDVYVWDEVYGGIYLSDHYPVCMEFDIENLE